MTQEPWNRIVESLRTEGHRAAITPMEHITELRKEVADRFEKGLIHGDLHASYLSGFRYQPPPGLPSARSMIVVAFRERQ